LTVRLAPDLARAFHDAHEERYGYADRGRPVELVAVRTADVTPGPPVELRATQQVRVRGPEVVELAGATCWVPAGWGGETDAHGTLVLERAA
jgi:N-methylhydantoinase A